MMRRHQTPPLPVLLLSILLFAAPSLAAHADDAAEAFLGVETEVGKAVVLVLKGNPSTGYQWRLNEARSLGADGVAIENLSWEAIEGNRRIGAPRLLRLEVLPERAGTATLVFDYLRPWESKPPARTVEFL
ncbi:MAG TPA: protease inhibitor I42 family protein, partial [Hyphomicrobiales bacterium]|nr:protease inhibitor I42 family protein [Hyphomicrobiales bacterium]